MVNFLFQCIHMDAVCNLENDCTDGADEYQAFCEALECAPYSRKCADGLECVKNEHFCDGIVLET